MKKILIGLIVFGLLAAALFFRGGLSGKAALSVSSDPSEQKILLDNVEVGTTPFFSDQLEEGDPPLSFGSFNQKVRLTRGALTAVSWILGPSESFSAGEVVWFSPSSTGSELLVIAKPAVEVFLGGESLGESPLSKSLEPGEYLLELKKEGYFSRSLRVSVREGFRLNVSASLAFNPFPEESKKLPSPHKNLTLLDLSTNFASLAANPALWVEGAVFWASRAEEESTYQFYLTLEGKLYDEQGSEVSLGSLTQTKEKYRIGYLGSSSASLTSAAKKTLSSLAVKLYPAPPQVEILETGLGFRSEERRVGKECRSRWSPYH